MFLCLILNYVYHIMECPRLNHFVRLNPNGTLSRCGHMVQPKEFASLQDLESSDWLKKIKNQFKKNIWPNECKRCRDTEQDNATSIRLNAIKLHEKQTQNDYLQVGGVLDNLCNAGCLTCSAEHSTKIGSLYNRRTFPIINNMNKFWSLPQERILHLDINGGEPSFSKNYKKLLMQLPPNLKTLRLNTNGSTVLYELINVVNKGIEVTVTISFDGVGDVHELVRWPLKWVEFYNNIMLYKSLPVKLNLWTTVSALNIDDLPNIVRFAKEHKIDHSYAYLVYPKELAVENKDTNEYNQFIQEQTDLRRIL